MERTTVRPSLPRLPPRRRLLPVLLLALRSRPTTAAWTYRDFNRRLEWNDLPAARLSLELTSCSADDLAASDWVVAGVLPPSSDNATTTTGRSNATPRPSTGTPITGDEDVDHDSSACSSADPTPGKEVAYLTVEEETASSRDSSRSQNLLLEGAPASGNSGCADEGDDLEWDLWAVRHDAELAELRDELLLPRSHPQPATLASAGDGGPRAGSTSSVLSVRHFNASQKLVGITLRQSPPPAGPTTTADLNLLRRDGRRVGSALAQLILDRVAKSAGQSTANQKTEERKKDRKIPPPRVVTVVLPPSVQRVEYLTDLVAALWLGVYKDQRFVQHCTDHAPPVAVKFVLIGGGASAAGGAAREESALAGALHRGAALARGAYLAKDIVNAPHNVLNAASLADAASRLAREHRRCLSLQVLSADDCEKRHMGAYLAVARAGEVPPQFLCLTYRPPGVSRRRARSLPRIAFVGKGVLFDTGGYNLKTSNMEWMKFDCGGAAAVLGALLALALLQPCNIVVHAVVAACDNLINERALVPGDVVTASNGKMIEVINTDAEGRLTLADALVFAERELRCREIIELSTLTGACVVALGGSVAGLWSKSDDLAIRLQAASDATGEKLWRMPLNEDDYGEGIRSKIADLKNVGTGRHGGAIAAALFLHHFVTEHRDTQFAHIDMAGPVWNYPASQATGWGTLLLAEYVCSRAAATATSTG